ncbi:hypothetical protein CEE37_11480 [candidate division LCP-89 bacterium B3_LCP]|uniref:Iron-sulfur cluster carrier protein n=1 Tax=candidate division LCP-89 bacterium B3_LCP TaxID=2012998 RepID=A0A532UW71_UNCL8|nr:MAG: hypothetical protein CEE37_11480 [candidate division LCP-89 bacterium B3_LCP]
MLKGVYLDDGKLVVKIVMNDVEDGNAQQIKEDVRYVLEKESGYDNIQLDIENKTKEVKQDQPLDAKQISDPQPLKGIKKIIAISSGKGGVGKSTVAVNLACLAAKAGKSVGIFDADIHGPSLPTLLGINQHPEATEDGMIPVDKHGVRSMSIGFIVEKGQPLIWRGPMLNKALEQICEGTKWGELDYLFVDLPPGTGDVQLSLAQKYKVDGAIIVTTPQNLALEDVRRGTMMFKQTNVPVLGIVENMSYYQCPNCNDLSHPFGEGGGGREAESIGVPLLGKLPLDPQTLVLADQGTPIVIAEPDSDTTMNYLTIWQTIERML